jgi:hypothetical protein
MKLVGDIMENNPQLRYKIIIEINLELFYEI